MSNKAIIAIVAVVVLIAAGVGIGFAVSNNNSSDNKGIEYIGNGGEQKLTGNTSIFDNSANIPDLSYEKSNCTFTGYTEKADGTGTLYKIGDKAPSVSKLYAQYAFNTKMTVKINDLPSTLKVTYNGTALKDGDVIEAPDCKFTVKVEGKETVYSFNQFYSSYSIREGSESGVIKYTMEMTTSSYSSSTSSTDLDTLPSTVFTISTEQIQTITFTFSASP